MRSLPLLALFCCLQGAAAASVVLDFHASAGTPASQGWLNRGGILAEQALASDLGLPAWQISGNGCCGYRYQPVSETWASIFAEGWTLSAQARVQTGTGYGYVTLDTPAGFNRFDLLLQLNPNGDTNAFLFTGDLADRSFQVTLAGNAYHLYEIRYDPSTASATLWIDGVERLSGYTGNTFFRENHGPFFGSNSDLSTKANFNFVRFASGDAAAQDVPEAASMICSGLGLLVMGLWQRRR
ncbi:MAG: hypothetical protein U0R19_26685 [Bryobacteraceae bacterium]